jgi:hypothetical protein
LPGTVSTATAKCGKLTCRCSSGKAKDLHGPYFRWSGLIDGRLTTKTISKEIANECEKRIGNYRKFQKKLHEILQKAILEAPWHKAKKR